MYSYTMISEWIDSLKKSPKQSDGSHQAEMIEEIVHKSDVFPDEEKEFMVQFLKEDIKESKKQSEQG